MGNLDGEERHSSPASHNDLSDESIKAGNGPQGHLLSRPRIE